MNVSLPSFLRARVARLAPTCVASTLIVVAVGAAADEIGKHFVWLTEKLKLEAGDDDAPENAEDDAGEKQGADGEGTEGNGELPELQSGAAEPRQPTFWDGDLTVEVPKRPQGASNWPAYAEHLVRLVASAPNRDALKKFQKDNARGISSLRSAYSDAFEELQTAMSARWGAMG